MEKIKRAPGLYAEAGRGFQITLENGYTVSVMFGPNHYCDNRDIFAGVPYEPPNRITSPNAEVAVIDPAGRMMDMSWFVPGADDTVIGWASADTVAQLIAEARLLPHIEKMVQK